MTPEQQAAQELMRMIETVDPSDTKKLDEIDLRAYAYVTGWEVIECGYIGATGEGDMTHPPQYTRSRDALKAIRPDGYVWTIESRGVAEAWSPKANVPTLKAEKNYNTHERLPTEELAELHAIIQAIEYERNNK